MGNTASAGAARDEGEWPGDLRTAWRAEPRGSLVCWLHLPSALLLLGVVGAAGLVLVDGLALRPAVARLPLLLYWWIPSAVGIAVATLPLNRYALRSAALLAAAGVFGLLVLDLLGGALQAQAAGEAVIIPGGESILAVARGSVQPGSWVMIFGEWISGELSSISERAARYPPGHPRLLMAQAIAEASAPLLVIGTLGVVLAVRRWLRDNVIFRRPTSELVAVVAVAWMIGPALSVLVTALTARQLTAALFLGGSLGGIALPCLASSLIGSAGLLFAFRPARWEL